MNSPAALPASKKHLQLYPECPILSRVSWECPILSGVSDLKLDMSTHGTVRNVSGPVRNVSGPVRSCPECVR